MIIVVLVRGVGRGRRWIGLNVIEQIIADLISVPARLARHARRLTRHLPRNWPWTDARLDLPDTLHASPDAA